MRCDICGSEETYIKDYEHIFNIKSREIRFTLKRRFCKKCNNLVYDDKLDNLASEMAISKYNEQYGITKEMIIDLRKKFKLQSKEPDKESRIIVVEVNKPTEADPDHICTFGAVCDSVQEVLEVEEMSIEPPPKFGNNISSEFISGIVKKDSNFIIILDEEKIFSEEDILKSN